MKLKPFIFITIASSLFSTTLLANQSLLIEKNKNLNEPLLYWTPERLREAKPLDMPVVNRDAIKRIPIDNHLETNFAIQSGDGKGPDINLEPTGKKLFEPKNYLLNQGSVTPLDRGTRNEHFSSTQLVPLTADLAYPYRAVGKLFFTIPGQGNYVCSAAVLRPRIVVTAGHCVHRGSGGASGFYTNWLFIPAYRDGAAPFLQWGWSAATVSNTWAGGNGGVPNAADFAMLEMGDKVINNVTTKIASLTGYFGYQTESLIPNHVNMLGYPCNFDSCRKMHQVTAQSAVAVAPNNVEYGSDMAGGSSGGPWVQNFGSYSVGQTGGLNAGINRIVGVTSWGYTNSALKAQGASNFNAEFIQILNTICAHRAGNC